MTKRHKKEKGVLIEEHPNRPGQADIIGHQQLRKMKMGVNVRGEGIIQNLKERLNKSKKDLGLEVSGDKFGERKL